MDPISMTIRKLIIVHIYVYIFRENRALARKYEFIFRPFFIL